MPLVLQQQQPLATVPCSQNTGATISEKSDVVDGLASRQQSSDSSQDIWENNSNEHSKIDRLDTISQTPKANCIDVPCCAQQVLVQEQQDANGASSCSTKDEEADNVEADNTSQGKTHRFTEI